MYIDHIANRKTISLTFPSRIFFIPCAASDSFRMFRPRVADRRRFGDPGDATGQVEVAGFFFPKDLNGNTLQETNISPKNGILKMMFLFPFGGIC